MTNTTNNEATTVVSKRDEARTPENLRRILSYQLISKHLTDQRKDFITQARLEAGERIEITTEWGAKLGTLSCGQTTQKLVMVDPAVVLANAEASETELFIADIAEAIEVLEEYAPHVLGVRLTQAGEKRLETQAKKQWEKTGKAPTGWAVQNRVPTPRATATNLAKELAAEALAGPIDNILQIEAASTDEVEA